VAAAVIGAVIEPVADAGSASVEVAVEPTGPVVTMEADAPPLGPLLDRLAAGLPEPDLGDDAASIPTMFDAPEGRELSGPRDPLESLYH
jgi:hypothetical protein